MSQTFATIEELKSQTYSKKATEQLLFDLTEYRYKFARDESVKIHLDAIETELTERCVDIPEWKQ